MIKNQSFLTIRTFVRSYLFSMYFFQTLYFCSFWWYTSEKFENKHVLDCIWSKGSEKLAFFTLSTLPPNGTFMDDRSLLQNGPFSAFKDSLIAYFILSFFPQATSMIQSTFACQRIFLWYFWGTNAWPLNFELVLLRVVAEKILVFCHLCHTYLAPEKVTGMLPFFRATIVV